MVHCFTYTHKGNPLYFVWDVESGSLHNVDEAAFLVSKKRYQQLSDDENKLFLKLSESDLKEIDAELDLLEKDGVLNAPEVRINLPSSGEIKAMCLHICHDCNLRCSYCFAKDGTYNTPRDYMSFEVGKAALDFLFANSGKRHNLEVDFFGGEPLMNLDNVKKIVAYGKEKAKSLGKDIKFTLTTNGVLLNDDAIKYLNEEMDNVVISIDGRREIHDKLRVTPNGKGSYDIALKNAKKFRAVRGDKRYYIRGTFTQNNVDFSHDVLVLNDEGFDQISIEPVVLPDDSPLALHEKDLPEIFKQYDELSEEYIERRKGDKWFNFFHYMIDLKTVRALRKGSPVAARAKSTLRSPRRATFSRVTSLQAATENSLWATLWTALSIAISRKPLKISTCIPRKIAESVPRSIIAVAVASRTAITSITT